MKISDLRELIKSTEPEVFTGEQVEALLEAFPPLSVNSDRESDFGNRLHRAIAYHDFRYYLIKAMDRGWKEVTIIRTGQTVGVGFSVGDEAWPLHDAMIDFIMEPVNRKVLLAPRGSYKSTLVLYWLSWQIGRNPNIRILYNTETYSLALAYIQSMKTVILQDEYTEIFGEMRGDTGWKDSGLRVGPSYPGRQSEDSHCKGRTSKEATLQPAGVDKGITGGHYEIIVNDDVVTETNTRTKNGIQKVIDWYRSLEPILDPGSLVMLVGTRYDHGELFGELEENHYELYRWMVLEADTGDFKPTYRHLTEEWLREKYETMGSYMYSCQYRNKPISHEDQLFFREQFQLIHPDDVPYGVNRYLLLDAAASAEGGLSRTAMVVVGLDSLKNIYVLHAFIKKLKPSEVLNELFSTYFQFGVKHMTIEQTAWAEVYKALIETEERLRQQHITIRSLRNRTERSKDQRILSLQGPFEAGRIFWVDTIHNDLLHTIGGSAYGEIVEEFIGFPKGKRKDFADALSDVMWIDSNGSACPAPRHNNRQVVSRQQVHLDKMVNGRYPSQMAPQKREVVAKNSITSRRPAQGGWRNRSIVGGRYHVKS